MCIRIHIQYVHTYTRTVCAYVYTYMCVHTYTRTVCAYVYTYMYVHTYTRTVCAYVYTYSMCIRIHIHVQYVHMYTYMYIVCIRIRTRIRTRTVCECHLACGTKVRHTYVHAFSCLSHHFPAEEHCLSRWVYVLLHKSSLTRLVGLSKKCLDLHPHQLSLAVAKDLTSIFVCNQDEWCLCADGDQGLVGCSRGGWEHIRAIHHSLHEGDIQGSVHWAGESPNKGPAKLVSRCGRRDTAAAIADTEHLLACEVTTVVKTILGGPVCRELVEVGGKRAVVVFRELGQGLHRWYTVMTRQHLVQWGLGPSGVLPACSSYAHC